jgi:hypothetical protein
LKESKVKKGEEIMDETEGEGQKGMRKRKEGRMNETESADC